MIEKFLKSVIFCDFVRLEAGGTNTLVGVYPGRIILPQIPTTLQRLYVWMEFYTDGLSVPEFEVQLLAPSGKAVFVGSVKADLKTWKRPVALVIYKDNCLIRETGCYSFQGRIKPTDEWKEVRDLFIDILAT